MGGKQIQITEDHLPGNGSCPHETDVSPLGSYPEWVVENSRFARTIWERELSIERIYICSILDVKSTEFKREACV